MNELTLDINQIHPVSDFIRNHKAHITRLKQTRSPEVLTVNGRAEVFYSIRRAIRVWWRACAMPTLSRRHALISHVFEQPRLPPNPLPTKKRNAVAMRLMSWLPKRSALDCINDCRGFWRDPQGQWPD